MWVGIQDIIMVRKKRSIFTTSLSRDCGCRLFFCYSFSALSCYSNSTCFHPVSRGGFVKKTTRCAQELITDTSINAATNTYITPHMIGYESISTSNLNSTSSVEHNGTPVTTWHYGGTWSVGRDIHVSNINDSKQNRLVKIACTQLLKLSGKQLIT